MDSLATSPGPAPSKLQIPSRRWLKNHPLATARLLIEPISSARSLAFFLAVEKSRAALAQWLPWVPYNDSPDASLRYTRACEADWDRGAAVRFFLQLKTAPEIVGVVSLENCNSAHRSCDLGYWLSAPQHGKGLMKEATVAMVDYAFSQMGVHRLRAAAALDNVPSRRLIESLGFQTEGIARDAEFVAGRWVSHAVYSLLSSDQQVVPDADS